MPDKQGPEGNECELWEEEGIAGPSQVEFGEKCARVS